MIKIDHLVKNYGNICAVDDISFEIEAGEIVGLLGPNGAGTTTCVKLLLGLAWPLWGASVSVLGQKYGECNILELRKKVAWVSPFLNTWAADSTYSRRWTAREIVLGGIDSTIGFFRTPTAEDLEQAENAAWRLMQKFDPGIQIPQITYNRKFAVRDLSGSISGLLQLKELDSGPEFRKALSRSALDLLSAVGNVGTGERTRILDEIEKI